MERTDTHTRARTHTHTNQVIIIMKSTEVQTLGTILLKGEQTGMKLSCIKPHQKSEVYISIEPGSSTGYIDACIYIVRLKETNQ